MFSLEESSIKGSNLELDQFDRGTRLSVRSRKGRKRSLLPPVERLFRNERRRRKALNTRHFFNFLPSQLRVSDNDKSQNFSFPLKHFANKCKKWRRTKGPTRKRFSSFCLWPAPSCTLQLLANIAPSPSSLKTSSRLAFFHLLSG